MQLDMMPLVSGSPSVPTSVRGSSSGAFASDAAELLARLQGGIKRLLKAGKTPVTRAIELQRAVEIRAPLAWQIYRWSIAEDPLATVEFIPKPEAMAKVLAAAAAAGFRAKAVTDVERLYREFVAFIDLHAGERGEFDAMISALDHAPTPQIDLRLRRDGFRVNSRMWGLAASTLYNACIYHHAGDAEGPLSGRLASTVVKGIIDLRALRPLDAIPISKRHLDIEHGGEVTDATSEFMVFEDFSSNMGKDLLSVRHEDEIRDSLQLRGVGVSSKTTLFVGACARNVPIDLEDPSLAVGCTIHVPCELVILDLLIPARISEPSTPHAYITGTIDDPLKAVTRRMNPAWRMPGSEAAHYIGSSLDSLRCEEVPYCPQLIRAAIRRVGWESEQYHIYRTLIQYPVLHTLALLESKMSI